MHWSDLYVPPTKVKNYQKIQLSGNELDNFNSFFKQDVALFAEFNKTFWQKVENYGVQKMERDVTYLKQLYSDCAHAPTTCLPAVESNFEPIKMQTLEKGSQQELFEYMVRNGGDCEWGLIPKMKDKYKLTRR